jgi:hypothetical protein
MAATFYEQRRNLGLAGGSLWLIVVGTAYAAWVLLAVRSTLATVLLVAMCICAVCLTLFGIAMIAAFFKRHLWIPYSLQVDGRLCVSSE